MVIRYGWNDEVLSSPPEGAPSARVRRFIADQRLEDSFVSTPNRIRLALANALDSPQCRIEAMADLFNLHSRTLQRHLEAEGTSFEVLRDDARRDAARRYLTSTRLPLAQVAGLLGLSEQSALTRACKRWFDATPKSIRAQVQ